MKSREAFFFLLNFRKFNIYVEYIYIYIFNIYVETYFGKNRGAYYFGAKPLIVF